MTRRGENTGEFVSFEVNILQRSRRTWSSNRSFTFSYSLYCSR